MKQKRNILVVDDQADDRLLTKLCLERYGFNVIDSASWNDARNKLEKEKLELLVLDVKMPEGDALGLVKELRDNGQNIPIILYSCYLEGPNSVLDYVGKGADAVITKSSHPRVLLAKIEELLGGKGSPQCTR